MRKVGVTAIATLGPRSKVTLDEVTMDDNRSLLTLRMALVPSLYLQFKRSINPFSVHREGQGIVAFLFRMLDKVICTPRHLNLEKKHYVLRRL